MSLNMTVFLYLISSVCFIQALKGLSHPKSARLGNVFGMIGMVIAVITTLASLDFSELLHQNIRGFSLLISGLLIGSTLGAILAKRIEMTKMPELVAVMHSFIGLSAVFIAAVAVREPQAFGIVHVAYDPIPLGNRFELFVGTFIGAITFTGSLIAFFKLSGKVKKAGVWSFLRSAPTRFSGQHQLNLVLALVMLACGGLFFLTQNHLAFGLMLLIALALGVLLIIPIGGADMPVIVSMLNSYSGWAAAGIGFSLNNPMLIIAGALVGSSGAILSYIMCKAMNRSFIHVLLGGLGSDASAGQEQSAEQRPVRSGSADDVAFLLSQASSVVIVPGYGLAVARAQHAVKELAHKLSEKGILVRYAIHPVAGRMPGHMNVLLAEAEVPYESVLEMDEINSEFGDTDVVLVLGANDVVNPAAKTDPKSPIAGMPILEAYKARTIIVNKRSMAAGYAGLDNELFYLDKTMMVFGDAKKVVEDILKAVD